MNRRGFLGLLAGAAATKAVTYFLPPIGGWSSDVILNSIDFIQLNGGMLVGVEAEERRSLDIPRSIWDRCNRDFDIWVQYRMDSLVRS